MSFLVDSYGTENAGFGVSVTSTPVLTGQSFTGNGINLATIDILLNRVGSASYNLTLYVYAHTGTYGSTGKPTGSPLATSNPVVHSSLSTSNGLVTFTFPTPILLVDGVNYCWAVGNDGASISAYFNVISDATSPTHAGNRCSSSDSGSTWSAIPGSDSIFYVYGTTHFSPFPSSRHL